MHRVISHGKTSLMKKSPSLSLWTVAALTILTSACGSKNNTQVVSGTAANSAAPAPTPAPLPEISATTGDYEWFVGTWKLNGIEFNFGDLGMTIREMKITPTEAWVEKFGHLAAESWGRFNKDGFDYGGNCLFKVHSKDFAIEIENNVENTSDIKESLVFNTRSYELIEDPGNRDDCDKQIARMNQIIIGEPRYWIGAPVKVTAHSFRLNDTTNYDRAKSEE